MQEARAKAEAERAAVLQELEALKADLSRQKASAGAASNKAAGLIKDVASARAEREALAEKLNEAESVLKAKSDQHAICQRDLQATQKDLGATRVSLGETNARLGSSLNQCVTFNHELHEIGTDLLQRYENKGFGEVLGVNEPFIQKARVRLENISGEIKDKLDARRLSADQ